jgi:hypothetical protein
MRGIIFRYFKSYVAVPVTILLLCAAMIPNSASCTESRPEVYYGNTVFGIDFIDSGMSQVLTHRNTLGLLS